MRAQTDQHQISREAGRDVSIDYLRAFATVLVLVIHCSAPYTHVAQAMRPASWQSPIPIIDTSVSSLLDCILTYLDASTMSLMFFISGLFVYPGLRKKGVVFFLRDRLLRLGLPFAGMALVLMPIAYYMPWSMLHPGGTLTQFWRESAHMRFPTGPGWFLWVLFFFDCSVACLYLLAGDWLHSVAQRLRTLKNRPSLFALGMVGAGILLYLPLALRYAGVWLAVLTPPFVLQPSRALYYAAWFAAGLLVGASGLKQGLLARDGRLAQSPVLWAILGLLGGNALWFGTHTAQVLKLGLLAQCVTLSLLWILADTGICLGLLSIFRGLVHTRRGWADSLARNAYAIYAFHYIFAMAIERLLLGARLGAWPKFLIAVSVTLGCSWLAAMVWLRLWESGVMFAGRLAGAPAAALAAAGAPGQTGRTDNAA